MLKKNLRLVIFFGGVLVLAIYLFATTNLETKKVTTQQPTTTQSSATAESSGEEAALQESTEDPEAEAPVEAETGELKTEARPATVAAAQEIDGHQLLTENANYQLYLKESNLSLILRDKQTGAVMYSTVDKPQGANDSWSNFIRSAVVVNYITDANTGFNQLDMISGTPEVSVKKAADGFTAAVNWKEQQLSFDLKVTLTDEGITAAVSDDSIEEKSDKYKIGEIYLYPFMGYSMMGEEDGYMFLPDGSGSLISLQDNNGQFKQPFSQPWYGQDLGVAIPRIKSTIDDRLMSNEANQLTAPIFGMVHTKKGLGYLAVVEKGDANAVLEAYPNGAILPYNWITAKFTYRTVYAQATSRDSGSMMIRQKNRNRVDAQVAYRFVNQEQASYYGLAQNYREYLLANDLIKQTTNDSLLRVDLFGADNENSLITKKMQLMTTFSQMGGILDKLQKAQLDRVTVGIKAWQAGGAAAGTAQNSLQAEKGLGGNSDLETLLADYQDDFTINLYDDLLLFNPESQNESKFDLFTRLNKKLYSEATFGPVYPEVNYLTPEQSSKIFAEFQDSAASLDKTGVTVAGITEKLFSYSKDGKNYDRTHSMEVYGKLLAEAAEKNPLELETPLQAYWQYASALTQVPLRSSNYIFETQEIPFFGLALRGLVPMYAPYINFEANREEYLLKVLESGINPSFLVTEADSRDLRNSNSSAIYTSKYSTFQDEIIAVYQQVESVETVIGDAAITDHRRSGDQVAITYENGVKLLLNYSNKSVDFDGHKLEAYAYKVVK